MAGLLQVRQLLQSFRYYRPMPLPMPRLRSVSQIFEALAVVAIGTVTILSFVAASPRSGDGRAGLWRAQSDVAGDTTAGKAAPRQEAVGPGVGPSGVGPSGGVGQGGEGLSGPGLFAVLERAGQKPGEMRFAGQLKPADKFLDATGAPAVNPHKGYDHAPRPTIIARADVGASAADPVAARAPAAAEDEHAADARLADAGGDPETAKATRGHARPQHHRVASVRQAKSASASGAERRKRPAEASRIASAAGMTPAARRAAVARDAAGPTGRQAPSSVARLDARPGSGKLDSAKLASATMHLAGELTDEARAGLPPRMAGRQQEARAEPTPGELVLRRLRGAI